MGCAGILDSLPQDLEDGGVLDPRCQPCRRRPAWASSVRRRRPFPGSVALPRSEERLTPDPAASVGRRGARRL